MNKHKLLRTIAMGYSLVCSATAIAGPIRAVALVNRHAPDTAAGVNFSQLLDADSSNRPFINASGEIAYWGRITGPGVGQSNDKGIWLDDGTSAVLEYRIGTLVPSQPVGVTFTDFITDVRLNANGQVAFQGLTAAGPGIWSEQGGSLHTLAQKGVVAPGTSTQFFAFQDLRFSNNGTTEFVASLSPAQTSSSDDRGIWTDVGGSVQLLVRESDHAPGTPAGVVFENLFNSLPLLNVSGQTAFWATLTGPGVTTSTNTGLWTRRAASIELVAREGNAAPGTSAGVVFGDVGTNVEPAAFNAAAHTSFEAKLAGPVSSSNNTGIWSDRSGTLSLVARTGSAAPGVGAGVTFSELSSPILNNADRIVFAAQLAGNVTEANNSGIWSDVGGSLQLLIREGTHAPGTPDNVVFTFGTSSRGIVLNGVNKVAFYGFLVGPGVTAANDEGIWAQDRNGQFTLIAREGMQIEVAPGELHAIQTIRFASGTGNGDGLRSGFNDNGLVSFYAYLSDNLEGIFVSSAVVVPEPSALMLGGCALIVLIVWAIRVQRS